MVGVGYVFQLLSYPLSGAERKPRYKSTSGACEARFHDTRGESPAWHQLFHVEHSCRLVSVLETEERLSATECGRISDTGH